MLRTGSYTGSYGSTHCRIGMREDIAAGYARVTCCEHTTIAHQNRPSVRFKAAIEQINVPQVQFSAEGHIKVARKTFCVDHCFFLVAPQCHLRMVHHELSTSEVVSCGCRKEEEYLPAGGRVFQRSSKLRYCAHTAELSIERPERWKRRWRRYRWRRWGRRNGRLLWERRRRGTVSSTVTAVCPEGTIIHPKKVIGPVFTEAIVCESACIRAAFSRSSWRRGSLRRKTRWGPVFE
eukprot:2131899-Prymnesium_polylepis.2